MVAYRRIGRDWSITNQTFDETAVTQGVKDDQGCVDGYSSVIGTLSVVLRMRSKVTLICPFKGPYSSSSSHKSQKRVKIDKKVRNLAN